MWSTVSEIVGMVLVLAACVALFGVWPAMMILGLVLVAVGWAGGER